MIARMTWMGLLESKTQKINVFKNFRAIWWIFEVAAKLTCWDLDNRMEYTSNEFNMLLHVYYSSIDSQLYSRSQWSFWEKKTEQL